MIKLGVINVSDILNIRFKHIFTYTVLFYVVANLNTDKHIVKLTASIFILKCNASKTSAENAIKELIDYKIIVSYDKTKKLYRVNQQYVIDVKEVYSLSHFNKDNYEQERKDK